MAHCHGQRTANPTPFDLSVPGSTLLTDGAGSESIALISSVRTHRLACLFLQL
uniref:Uncharacterized protein n=1 Tax=Arundo donax TaxID=35708 RepID=A0A0A9AZ86_ARUDO